MKRLATLTALMLMAASADMYACGCVRMGTSFTTVPNPSQGNEARERNASLKRAFFKVQGMTAKIRRSEDMKAFEASNDELVGKVRAELGLNEEDKRLARLVANHNRQSKLIELTWKSFKDAWEAAGNKSDILKSDEAGILKKQARDLAEKTHGALKGMTDTGDKALAAMTCLADPVGCFGVNKDILSPMLEDKKLASTSS